MRSKGILSLGRRGLDRIRSQAGSLLHLAAWWLTPTPPASYLTSYMRHRRIYSAALGLHGTPWGTLWDWETKVGVRQLASELGILTPEIYQGPVPVSQLDWSLFPRAFVIKPDRGTGKTGVYVLKQLTQDSFKDIIRNRTVTRQQVEDEILTLGKNKVVSDDRVIVEQALLQPDDSIAYEWKCYAFQGEVGLIWQISRGSGSEGRRNRFLDTQWRALGRVRRATPVTRELPPPTNPEVILSTARRLSAAVSVPFVRVDLYECEGSVYLGELTPVPGSAQRFKRKLDRELGEAWQRAEVRLLKSSK